MSDRSGPFGRFPKSIQALIASFDELEDPRQERGRRHLLMDVVIIALLAMMSDQDDAQGFEDWGNHNEQWLKQFLELPYGIPSQDTFLRVFSMIEPDAFRDCFLNWVAQLKAVAHGHHLAIDGKTLRGSADKASGERALHMVSAWLSDAGLVLGQIATDKKSNEIKAIPQLLELIDIRDCTVTIDAMGCQRAISEKIVERGGYYLLAVKDNQPTLAHEIAASFKASLSEEKRPLDMLQAAQCLCHQSNDAGHGRIETRTAYFTSDLSWLDESKDWPHLKGIGMVVRERTEKSTELMTTEAAYFITNDGQMTAEKLCTLSRAHWSIENSLHWVLDVTFNEDKYRARKLNAAHNFALVRHVLIGMLKAEKTFKRSIAKKRKRCAYDPEYILTVLATQS